MIRYTLLAILVAIACYVGGARAQGGVSTELAAERQLVNVLRGDYNQAATRRCRHPITRYAWPDVRRIPAAKAKAVRATWENRVQRMRAKPSRCGTIHHRNLWLCIHRHEGAWNDPNPPYFGGLQMGYWFMQTYGGQLYRTKGTADRWTPNEQMRVADRAYHSTGHFERVVERAVARHTQRVRRMNDDALHELDATVSRELLAAYENLRAAAKAWSDWNLEQSEEDGMLPGPRERAQAEALAALDRLDQEEPAEKPWPDGGRPWELDREQVAALQEDNDEKS